jgi:hypothetical protein
MTDPRLPSAHPLLRTHAHLLKLVRKQIDSTVQDIRALLLLRSDRRNGGGNCEIATAAVLFNLIGGLSVLVFEASEEGLRGARGRGRRFRAMLRAHYPWRQDSIAPGTAIEVLYDYARNQMAHSLGLGLGTTLRPAPEYGYAKPPLTPQRLAELETSQRRPAWAQPTVYTVDLSRWGITTPGFGIALPTLYWGIRRLLESLLADPTQARAADALAERLGY